VYAAAREPLADVRLAVRFSGIDGEFILFTDALGRYEVEGPATSPVGVSVTARCAGYTPRRVQETVVDTRVIDIELAPLTSVTVELDGAGSAPPAVTLELRASTGSRRTSRILRPMVPTGKADTLTTRGIPEGTWTLFLRAPGHALISLGTHRLSDPAGHHLGRHRLTAGGTVAGTVVDQNREPVAGATVTIPDLELTTTTDAEGKFTFEHVADGRFNLRAFGPPRRPRRLEGMGLLWVQDGKVAGTTIRLR
jgi:hypothetical protein